MPTKTELRAILRANLSLTIERMNEALSGKHLEALEPVLSRIGRGKQLPHWYVALRETATLANLDGKTIGSVVEMLLVAVLETYTFAGRSLPPLRVNPARGVDLPDLDLGIKAPSENYCTSEPFFSAYERLIGSEYDALVLLTDYQTAKDKPPLKLKIINQKYVTGSQLADRSLCSIALQNRAWLLESDEGRAKRVFRFLAFINQSDWRAKRILAMLEHMRDEGKVKSLVKSSELEFAKTNVKLLSQDKVPLADAELNALRGILGITPSHIGVIDAADNWVSEVCKEAARPPNDNEWRRLCTGPLDGMIGMSLALQWRYNFGSLFRTEKGGAKNELFDDSSTIDSCLSS